jgi:pyocin large subunit-like protein
VFSSSSEDDFLTKVHAFIDNPPSGVLTLTRSNGDKLMYDPKGNIFAVADKNGAPRTLFKPKDGQAYWDKQKDAEARGDDYGGSRRSARKSGSDDNG